MGVRQCGKSALIEHLLGGTHKRISFDDLRLRTLAESDPALFLDQNPGFLFLDEAQYVPNLFPEIKLRIDRLRREGTREEILVPARYVITGSNQTLLEKQVRETLAGRATRAVLHTLSVAELARSSPASDLGSMFLRGGFPELFARPELDPVAYLNEYVASFIEKDILSAAGIEKRSAFSRVLQLLAARSAGLLNLSELARDAGVQVSTVQDWVSVLETNRIVFTLQPYHSNLGKRLIKTPKIHFLDVGLAARLQGWYALDPLLRSPQAGPLFETLVLAELVKHLDHRRKPWSLHHWRTKEKEEVDFLLTANRADGTPRRIALDAKLGIQSVTPQALPRGLRKTVPDVRELVLVTYGGEAARLSSECWQVPVRGLGEFLESRL